jgi:hypothetical protein
LIWISLEAGHIVGCIEHVDRVQVVLVPDLLDGSLGDGLVYFYSLHLGFLLVLAFSIAVMRFGIATPGA